jgi:hypothetical protein
MTAPVAYRDIPKPERTRLADAILRTPKFLAMNFALIGVGIQGSRYIADYFVPEGRSSGIHVAVDFIAAGVLAALMALMLVRPLLKREVERAARGGLSDAGKGKGPV